MAAVACKFGTSDEREMNPHNLYYNYGMTSIMCKDIGISSLRSGNTAAPSEISIGSFSNFTALQRYSIMTFLRNPQFLGLL